MTTFAAYSPRATAGSYRARTTALECAIAELVTRLRFLEAAQATFDARLSDAAAAAAAQQRILWERIALQDAVIAALRQRLHDEGAPA